jgi:hypothetical protein
MLRYWQKSNCGFPTKIRKSDTAPPQQSFGSALSSKAKLRGTTNSATVLLSHLLRHGKR